MSIEDLKDNDGFIDISDLKFKKLSNFRNVYTLEYDNKKYYFKTIYNIKTMYNELIAEEIANDYDIPHIHYDLAVLDGNIGVISEDFIKDNETFTDMCSILKTIYNDPEDKTNHNNLTDIWNALSIIFNDEKIIADLMEQIVNIFIFDILIANSDRHDENYGIITGSETKIAPIYDNNYMLASISLVVGDYSLKVESDMDEDDNLLHSFLSISSEKYTELLKSKLWIIEDKNIDKIIKRVEEKANITIENFIKEDIKKKFSSQYERITSELNNYINKTYIK